MVKGLIGGEIGGASKLLTMCLIDPGLGLAAGLGDVARWLSIALVMNSLLFVNEALGLRGLVTVLTSSFSSLLNSIEDCKMDLGDFIDTDVISASETAVVVGCLTEDCRSASLCKACDEGGVEVGNGNFGTKGIALTNKLVPPIIPNG